MFTTPKHLIVLLLTLCLANAQAQTFNGGGAPIPDDGTPLNRTLNVSGLTPATLNATHGLVRVCFDINHSYIADLDVSVISPDGTNVLLTSAQGGSSNNYNNTCFEAFVSQSIIDGNPPYDDTYLPMGVMGNINNGQNGNGVWTLNILDTYPFANDGDLNYWSLTFGNNAQMPIQIETDLPLVVIETNGQNIPAENKVNVDFKIIDNPPGNLNHPTDPAVYEGIVGIETRGSSSATFPQKSYSFETRDNAGITLDTNLLSLPKENDWILYAPYTDKSLFRNTVAYKLSREMGHYAARNRLCEVVVNGDYKGIYFLTEKIKRDDDRVDIENMEPTDIIGDPLTGGYIVKIDKTTGSNNDGWNSDFLVCDGDPNQLYWQYHYPKPEDIVPQQQQYIRTYVDSFEYAINGPNFQDTVWGFRKFADEYSFIDFMLINELSKNVDGYRISSYFYKDRNSKGGKLTAGPVWDFNLGFGNADYYDGAIPDQGWRWECNTGINYGLPFFFERMTQDTLFMKRFKCRYTALREDVLSEAYINSFIDSLQNRVVNAQVRHFDRWPILGTYVWPNAYVPNTYQEEIDTLKGWFRSRLAWMDTQLLTTDCEPEAPPVGILNPGGLSKAFGVRPNPAFAGTTLQLDIQPGVEAQTYLYDMSGRQVMHRMISQPELRLPDDLAPGVYQLLIVNAAGSYRSSLLIRE